MTICKYIYTKNIHDKTAMGTRTEPVLVENTRRTYTIRQLWEYVLSQYLSKLGFFHRVADDGNSGVVISVRTHVTKTIRSNY